MRPFTLLSLVALSVIITAKQGYAQPAADGVRYHFMAGDAVRYRVVAVDSIVIFDRVWRTLTRRRAEIVTYRCDSVLPNGNYLITVSTDQYAATERLDTLGEVTRTSHPWVGHPRTFVMSTTGRRLDMVRYERLVGSAPGGPFAPLPIPHLGDTIVARGNDVFTNKQWLFDNVYPPVGWDGTTYRQNNGLIDTLGEKLHDMLLTETATVYYRAVGGPDTLLTESRINGSGRYLLSLTRGYPVWASYDLIADIDLRNAHGETVQGRHAMSTIIELYTDDTPIEDTTPDAPGNHPEAHDHHESPGDR